MGAAPAPATSPHIAVLPTPGMGHLFPLAELAKRLVDDHGFTVTFITFPDAADCKTQQSFLASLPSSISSLTLPPVPLSDLPSSARPATRFSVASARSLPAVRSILSHLSRTTRLSAFIADLFASDTLSAATELGVPAYLFIPSNFMFTSLMLHLPNESKESEFRHRPQPVRLPGCVPIPGPDVMHTVQDRSNDCYKWMVHHSTKYRDADGILINTFDEIEPRAKSYFFNRIEPGWPVMYPVGPLIRSVGSEHECLDWLDKHPAGSVVFVSFGSRWTISRRQMTELAAGLEASGQRFLWVVRTPHDADAGAVGDDFFPDGFVERMEGRGMVVQMWAPQVGVLGHGSTGGFVSHCGWNSTLESVSHGVPMLAWPLFAEQRQNAVMLAAEGVAMRMVEGEDGLYGKEEIGRAVRELMEGEEGRRVRRKAKEMKVAAAAALAEGGSSWRAINEVADRWKKGSVAV